MNDVINEINYPYMDVLYGGKTYRFIINMYDTPKEILGLIDEVFTNREYVDDKCKIISGYSVLDGGAHIGMFTVFALLNGAKRVIAVEPNPIIFPILKYNIERNVGNDNVIFVNKALWSSIKTRPHRLRFLHHKSHSAGSKVTQKKRQTFCYVNSTTIDAIGSEFGKIDFIKLDVEGSEKEVLAGARETIKNDIPHLSISLYHKGNDMMEIPNIVKDFNVGYGEVSTSGKRYTIGHWGKPD